MFQIGFKHVAWEDVDGYPGDRDAPTEKWVEAKFPILVQSLFSSDGMVFNNYITSIGGFMSTAFGRVFPVYVRHKLINKFM